MNCLSVEHDPMGCGFDSRGNLQTTYQAAPKGMYQCCFVGEWVVRRAWFMSHTSAV